MKNNIRKYILYGSLFLFGFGITLTANGCSDNDSEEKYQITISDDMQSLNFEEDGGSHLIEFTANSSWKIAVTENTSSGVENCSWAAVKTTNGIGGNKSSLLTVNSNSSSTSRVALVTIYCGTAQKEIIVNQAGSTLQIMSESDIEDFNKFYKPYDLKNIDMLRSDAKWSWFRSKQSEHFIVFWEAGFGSDPNADSVEEALRVDIDDLLAKAEVFYRTNVETLKFVEVGQSKSYLDQYKMQIYLLYQTEWLATGAGYDNVIGALWVNPSTCKPVGSTIAHEIGHSFQYQVYCDKLLNGATNDFKQGFRYGYAADASGGNSFWEQCAQWQAFQDYPDELFGYHVDVWKANYHRHFNHEWMRYASYWLQYYWKQKHGVDVIGEIWKQSAFPEDPIMAYQRLYCNDNPDKMYEELYEYASHMVTYDIDIVRNYATEDARNYSTKMFESDGYYQVGYASCPGTTGFNIIPLNLPEGNNTIKVTFEGLSTGSALSANDSGNVLNGDGATISYVSSYNTNNNTDAGWRYGFVSVVNGSAQYSPMYKDVAATISYDVPSATSHLYLVVMGAPNTYESHPWNDDELDDAQWPYRVKLEGTDILGNFYVDETATPRDITLSHVLSCNASFVDYVQGSINLATSQQLAQAFSMKPSTLESKMMAVGQEPQEGKIAIALQQSDASLVYSGNANNGFWCTTTGDLGNWNDGGVYFEFTGLTINYGHRPGTVSAGITATMKPVLIYTRNGVQYKATIELNMQFN